MTVVTLIDVPCIGTDDDDEDVVVVVVSTFRHTGVYSTVQVNNIVFFQ